MLTWGISIAVVVVLLAVLALGSAAGSGSKKAGRELGGSMNLTDKDEAWILSGRPRWSPELSDAWHAAISRAERYETKGGAARLKLRELGADSGLIEGLARIFFLAAEAHRDGLVTEFENRFGPNAKMSDHATFLRKEERIDQKLRQLEEKLYSAQSDYDAKHFWWVEIDDTERAAYRRGGQTWRDFRN